MNRKTQVLLAGAGAVAAFYALRLIGGKRINTLPYGYGIKLKRAVSINASAGRLYRYWRDVANLGKLLNVVSAQVLDGSRSHWTLKAPGGINLEWDAEITVD